MNAEPPEELTRFHRATMLRLAGIFVVLVAVHVTASRLGDAAPGWLWAVFLTGIAIFMLYVLHRAFVAKPECPDCRRRMRQTETVTLDGGTWRIVECPGCGKRFRIPGLP